MKALPIRWKFALWAAALVGLVLLVFAGGTFVNLYHEQIEAVDLTIEAEARHVASLETPRVMAMSLDELGQFKPWVAVALFDEAGRMIRRSPALPESIARAATSESRLHTARAPDGKTWRLNAYRRGSSTLVIAHALEEVAEIVRDLLIAYALSLPFVLVVAALGGWWVAGRALRPLRELSAAAERVHADRLAWKVPPYAANDEIRRLGDVLDAMLGRLEKSFQQAQRFAADASHELRTPLTIMHGEIERLLHAPNLDRGNEETLLSLQEEIGRMDRITEHLLLLAKFDAGSVAMQAAPVDFSALVAAACEDAELLAAAQRTTLATTVAPGVFVTGDDAHLRRVVLTLLDNATRYNREGGHVECRLSIAGDHAELRVRNTGPGVPAASRTQLFQRFFRADPARARGGHGLGLSLAREIVHAHRGEIVLADPRELGWTEFVVTLPRHVLPV